MHVKSFHEETYDLPLTKTQRRVANALFHDVYTTPELGRLIGGAAVDNFMITRVFVSKLRKKLDGSGWTVTPNSGDGYRLVRDVMVRADRIGQ